MYNLAMGAKVEEGVEAPQPNPILGILYDGVCLVAYGIHWALALMFIPPDKSAKKK